MERFWSTAAVVAGLSLLGSPLWADSQDQRMHQQTHQQLRSHLGVFVDQSSQGGQEEGVTIQSVSPNSPAAQAGLRSGDVITQVDHRPVEDFRDLSNAISRCQPGDRVRIRIHRNGEERSLRVTLGSRQMLGQTQEAEEEDSNQGRWSRDRQARGQQYQDQDQDQQSSGRYGRDRRFQGQQYQDQDQDQGTSGRYGRDRRYRGEQDQDQDRQDRYSRGQEESSSQGMDLQRLMQRFRQLASQVQDMERQGQGSQRQYGRYQSEGQERMVRQLEQRVEDLEQRIEQAQRQGQRGSLLRGVQTQRWTRESGSRRGGSADEGVEVTDMDSGSQAADAGLRRGDVITHVDGRRISSPQELRQALQQAGAGQEVTLQVLRGSRQLELSARQEEGSRGTARNQGLQRLHQRVERLESRLREMEDQR